MSAITLMTPVNPVSADVNLLKLLSAIPSPCFKTALSTIAAISYPKMYPQTSIETAMPLVSLRTKSLTKGFTSKP